MVISSPTLLSSYPPPSPSPPPPIFAPLLLLHKGTGAMGTSKLVDMATSLNL